MRHDVIWWQSHETVLTSSISTNFTVFVSADGSLEGCKATMEIDLLNWEAIDTMLQMENEFQDWNCALRDKCKALGVKHLHDITCKLSYFYRKTSFGPIHRLYTLGSYFNKSRGIIRSALPCLKSMKSGLSPFLFLTVQQPCGELCIFVRGFDFLIEKLFKYKRNQQQEDL